MKPLRKLTGFIAAAALALTALGQQAAAADLKNDPFVTQNADRKNFEPGGQYHLFGTPRGSVADRTGKIDVTQAYKHQMGNLLIQQANIKGDIGYKTVFSGHGHEVHAPFDEHASRSASDEKGSVAEGFTVYRLNWSGHKHHPADGYDGPRGGGYPTPTGARDEYSYSVNGIARSIKFNPTDTRSISQRFRDNYANLGSNFADRANEANKKMFDHNPKLDRWGNTMEFINGVAAGAVNPFLSAGEAVGLGDALYGTGYAIDKATMYGIAPLSADGKLSAIGGLGRLGGAEKDIGNAVTDWSAENPNAAETVEAVFNVAAVTKATKLSKTGTGKTTVSEDFADAHAPMGSRYNQMNQPKNPDYQPVRNTPTEINGRQYSGHALDRMQDRGILPSVIENTIRTGQQTKGRNGTTSHYDPINNVKVITNQSGGVVTTTYGK
ncbi:MafB family polymorphic toxin [Neisseria sp. CCUG12390]|uniref:MafB family polymorphic toxin n=1 Tax=Neisseria sp. CCUG12390 TaxID=3392035 RepID=UPI003A10112A